MTKVTSKTASDAGEKGKNRTGAEALVQELVRCGVDHAFGVPGGAAIPIFDALCAEKRIKFVLTRHEQGATHMADGFARASGRPAAVLVTSGPGATNTVTGIMTAMMDSVPMLVVTGQSETAMLGKDAFQEADVFNITMPVVKHSYLVKRAEDIPRVVREAHYIAVSGRPGPVLIDVPVDVGRAEVPGDAGAGVDLPGYHPEAGGGTPVELEQIAAALDKAERPLLLAGHGTVIAGAGAALAALSEKLRAPVATTLLGKGVFPEDHALSVGMVGMHGTAYANRLVTECDLLLVLGARMDDRILGSPASFGAGAFIVHVDVDEAEFGKLVRPDVACRGDARRTLEALLPLVRRRTAGGAWERRVAEAKRKWPLRYAARGGIRPQRVIAELQALVEGRKVILATDVGQHQMWAAQFWRCGNPRRFVTSGGAGTMGFGLPAAIGAQLAHPDALVVALVGDGGFQMTMCELATACVQRLPVKVLVMNNHMLGMVRQLQDLLAGARHSGVELEGNPDFARVAKAYGAFGEHVTRSNDLRSALRRALAWDGPAVVDVETVAGEDVFPMVPPGRPLEEMLLEMPETADGKGGEA